MKWAWTLGIFGGTKVRVHVTFLFLLVFLAAKFWSESGPKAAAIGVGFFLTLFFCVILHEFGHALAARRFGIQTPDITLYPIGGIARLERMPKKPAQELVVAAAGPAVNVVIAGVLLVVILFMGSSPSTAPPEFSALTLSSFLELLVAANIVLVLFNLIPAFPMDGGRMLRALLAMIVDRPRATRWAATIGQGLAVVGGILAITNHAWILLLIAIFIFFAAGQEANMIEAQASYEGIDVRAAMETRFEVLRSGDTLKRASEMLLEGAQHDFPVVDDGGRCRGLLLRTDLMRSLANGQLDSPVGTIAITEFPVLQASQPLSKGLESLSAAQLPVAPVIDGDGAIEGLLTRENVAEFVTMRSAIFHGKHS